MTCCMVIGPTCTCPETSIGLFFSTTGYLEKLAKLVFRGTHSCTKTGRWPSAYSSREPVADEKTIYWQVEKASKRQQQRPHWKPAVDHPWRRSPLLAGGAEMTPRGSFLKGQNRTFLLGANIFPAYRDEISRNLYNRAQLYRLHIRYASQTACIGHIEKPQRDGGFGEGNMNACIVSR